MASLEDTVRSVVQDFMTNGVLFTALDVSNVVKQQWPYARHKEVRAEVRGMFASDIESQGWARTPITVTLSDGTTAEALLYHPLTDSWDLDSKYDVQQRAKTTCSVPAVYVASPTSAAVTMTSQPPTNATPVAVQAPSTPAPTARDQWNSLFQTQPSLFTKK